NACPGDPSLTQTANCPQRHLSIWLGLNQKDIDNWENPDYAGVVSRPWDAPQNPTDPTPKFLTDPITQEQITGGQAVISGTFTQTLAGITGFILSVGMAVDANVLIFERFKEEVRAGRTIPAAVDAAVRRAWPAIRDSNTSTLITCVILGFVGPAQVKGFAVVLGIGV